MKSLSIKKKISLAKSRPVMVKPTHYIPHMTIELAGDFYTSIHSHFTNITAKEGKFFRLRRRRPSLSDITELADEANILLLLAQQPVVLQDAYERHNETSLLYNIGTLYLMLSNYLTLIRGGTRTARIEIKSRLIGSQNNGYHLKFYTIK